MFGEHDLPGEPIPSVPEQGTDGNYGNHAEETIASHAGSESTGCRMAP
jgi:hypothetical protein